MRITMQLEDRPTDSPVPVTFDYSIDANGINDAIIESMSAAIYNEIAKLMVLLNSKRRVEVIDAVQKLYDEVKATEEIQHGVPANTCIH